MLAKLLKDTKRRDLIVVSFQQPAVDRFHELVPRIDLAPGIAGAAVWIFGGGSPGPGVAAFQVPITFGPTAITTAERVARAHSEGYAWQNWFSGDDRDAADSWRTPDRHVRGRHDDRPPAGLRARAALAPAAGELQGASVGEQRLAGARAFALQAVGGVAEQEVAHGRLGRAAQQQAEHPAGVGLERVGGARAARAEVLERPRADERLGVALLLDPADRRWAARRRSAATAFTVLTLASDSVSTSSGRFSASRSSTSTSFSEPCHSAAFSMSAAIS